MTKAIPTSSISTGTADAALTVVKKAQAMPNADADLIEMCRCFRAANTRLRKLRKDMQGLEGPFYSDAYRCLEDELMKARDVCEHFKMGLLQTPATTREGLHAVARAVINERGGGNDQAWEDFYEDGDHLSVLFARDVIRVLMI